MRKFLLNALIAGSLCFALSAPAQAGMPTFDAASLTAQLQEWTKALQTAEDSLKTEVSNLNIAIKNAAAPAKDLFESVSDLYHAGNQLYDQIYSTYSTINDFKEYYANNFGDPEFWEKCALQGCDPSGMLKSSAQTTAAHVTSALEASQTALKAADNTQQTVNKMFSEIGTGTNEVIVNAAKIQDARAVQASQERRNNGAKLDAIAEQNEREHTEKEARLAKTNRRAQDELDSINSQTIPHHSNTRTPDL